MSKTSNPMSLVLMDYIKKLTQLLATFQWFFPGIKEEMFFSYSSEISQNINQLNYFSLISIPHPIFKPRGMNSLKWVETNL